jgi:hypothetical protein
MLNCLNREFIPLKTLIGLSDQLVLRVESLIITSHFWLRKTDCLKKKFHINVVLGSLVEEKLKLEQSLDCLQAVVNESLRYLVKRLRDND